MRFNARDFLVQTILPILISIVMFIFLMWLAAVANAQTYLWIYRQSADCDALTDGKARHLCYDTTLDQFYKCVPSAGECDTAGEWEAVSGNAILADSGTLTLGGTSGSNNENLTLDFESISDKVTINSGTDVDTLGIIINPTDDFEQNSLNLWHTETHQSSTIAISGTTPYAGSYGVKADVVPDSAGLTEVLAHRQFTDEIDSVTMEAMVYLDDVTSITVMRLINAQNTIGAGVLSSIRLRDDGGQLKIGGAYTNGSDTLITNQDETNVTTGTWYHIKMSYYRHPTDGYFKWWIAEGADALTLKTNFSGNTYGTYGVNRIYFGAQNNHPDDVTIYYDNVIAPLEIGEFNRHGLTLGSGTGGSPTPLPSIVFNIDNGTDGNIYYNAGQDAFIFDRSTRIGYGGNTDFYLMFDATTSNGLLTWMEDEIALRNDGDFILQEEGDTRVPDVSDTDPHLRVYSADEGVSTDYIEMYHDQTDAQIVSGAGDLQFDAPEGIIYDSGWGSVAFLRNGTAGVNFSYDNTTFYQFIWQLKDETGNQYVISHWGAGKDHDHATQTNPTLYIHSDLDPDTSNIQYMGLTHNGDADDVGTGVLESGTNYISLMNVGDEADDDRIPNTSATDPTLRIYSADDTNADDYIEMYHDQQNAVIQTGVGSELKLSVSNAAIYLMDEGTTMVRWKSDKDFIQTTFTPHDNAGNHFIIGDIAGIDQDYDHPLATDPTLYVQSATPPNTANDEWISLTHNVTDGVIDVGSGTVKILDAITLVGANNNCILTVDDDGTCDAGTEIGEDNSIAICAVCAAN